MAEIKNDYCQILGAEVSKNLKDAHLLGDGSAIDSGLVREWMNKCIQKPVDEFEAWRQTPRGRLYLELPLSAQRGAFEKNKLLGLIEQKAGDK